MNLLEGIWKRNSKCQNYSNFKVEIYKRYKQRIFLLEIKFGIDRNEKNKNTSTMRKGNMKVTRSKPSKDVPFLFNGYCYKIN